MSFYRGYNVLEYDIVGYLIINENVVCKETCYKN